MSDKRGGWPYAADPQVAALLTIVIAAMGGAVVGLLIGLTVGAIFL